MNPFNPDAGETPAPTDPAVIAIVERAATVIWRAFPYFEWRFGARGRAFGRSDGGFLATLVELPAPMQEAQVQWLARLLAVRGMPSWLLEVQLELFGRIGRRAGWDRADSLGALAGQLRARRQVVMPDARLHACDEAFRVRAAGLPHRRAIGALIAAEVADRRLGIVTGADATLDWLLVHGPAPAPDAARWRQACAEARALAEASPEPAA